MPQNPSWNVSEIKSIEYVDDCSIPGCFPKKRKYRFYPDGRITALYYGPDSGRHVSGRKTKILPEEMLACYRQIMDCASGLDSIGLFVDDHDGILTIHFQSGHKEQLPREWHGNGVCMYDIICKMIARIEPENDWDDE